ncbi:MAG TPA: hypothetical protein VGC09_17840 [Rhodopila sp.]
MIHALACFDTQSRAFAREAARRLLWYAGCVAFGWLAFSTHSVTDLVNSAQFACTLGALIAVARAFGAGVRVDARRLTFWDEGLLLNLMAVGLHLTRRLVT